MILSLEVWWFMSHDSWAIVMFAGYSSRLGRIVARRLLNYKMDLNLLPFIFCRVVYQRWTRVTPWKMALAAGASPKSSSNPAGSGSTRQWWRRNPSISLWVSPCSIYQRLVERCIFGRSIDVALELRLSILIFLEFWGDNKDSFIRQ